MLTFLPNTQTIHRCEGGIACLLRKCVGVHIVWKRHEMCERSRDHKYDAVLIVLRGVET